MAEARLSEISTQLLWRHCDYSCATWLLTDPVRSSRTPPRVLVSTLANIRGDQHCRLISIERLCHQMVEEPATTLHFRLILDE